jgi:hypothetical protein
MNEMVERIAAIFDAEEIGDHDQSVFMARKIIAAMREPTLDMVSAGRYEAICMDDMCEGHPLESYQAMIDEALKD